VVYATGEKDTLVSALFSASFVVRDTVFRLPLAGMSSWCVVVVFGSTYAPVNPLFLLAGHGIIVSSKRGVGCGSSSSDPLFRFRFPRFSIKVSTCCLEEVSGVGLWGTLLLFRFLWLCHTSSVDPVWVWRMCVSSSVAVSDAVSLIPASRLSPWGVVVVIGSTSLSVSSVGFLMGFTGILSSV
jgi:hypothetical protein